MGPSVASHFQEFREQMGVMLLGVDDRDMFMRFRGGGVGHKSMRTEMRCLLEATEEDEDMIDEDKDDEDEEDGYADDEGEDENKNKNKEYRDEDEDDLEVGIGTVVIRKWNGILELVDLESRRT